jgi:hypothetical protein
MSTIDRIPIKPRTYLVESILLFLFCCQPFGLVAILHAARVDSFFSEGNYIGAEEVSREAGKWVKYALIAGLIQWILAIGIWGLMFAGIILSEM